MADDSSLRQRTDTLAEAIDEAFARFDGHEVRVDAGDAGSIYVALRGAKHDQAVGEQFAQRLVTWLDGQLGDDAAFDFGLSLGRGDRGFLLLIDVQRC